MKKFFSAHCIVQSREKVFFGRLYRTIASSRYLSLYRTIACPRMIVFTFRGRPIFARGKAMVAYTYYIQQQDEGIHPYPELRPAPRCADRLSPVVLLYLYIYAHNPQTHTRNANETLPFCGDTLSAYRVRRPTSAPCATRETGQFGPPLRRYRGAGLQPAHRRR